VVVRLLRSVRGLSPAPIAATAVVMVVIAVVVGIGDVERALANAVV
jgi:hypothetical protein